MMQLHLLANKMWHIRYCYISALAKMAAVDEQRQKCQQLQLSFSKTLSRHMNKLFIHQVLIAYCCFLAKELLLSSIVSM